MLKHMCIDVTYCGHHDLMMLQLVKYVLINLWSNLCCHTRQGMML